MKHLWLTLIMITALSSLSLQTFAEASAADIAAGKKLAFNKKKGNCLACHMIDDGALPGNIAPPLMAMKFRFPDKKVLKAQVSDARKKNPHTLMPPFGPYELLTEKEIDQVVNYLLTL